MQKTARLLIAAALLVGGCASAAPTTPKPSTTTTRPAAKPAATATLTGQVLAPTGVTPLVGAGAGNLVGAGAGNLVGAGAGNLVGAGAGNYFLAASAEAPLAGTWVALADASGKPFEGVKAVQTGADGTFTLKGVPAGTTYVLQAAIKTAAGKETTLQSVGRAGAGGQAELSAASTCVTVALLAKQAADAGLGELDEDAFAQAIAATREGLSAEKWPDLADRAAITTAMTDLEARIPALRDALAGVRERLNKALAEAQAKLGGLLDKK